MTTNELELAKTLREQVGLEQEKAEAVANAIFDAIRSNVATRGDIENIRSDMKLLRAEMHEIELRLDNKIDKITSRLGTIVVIAATLLFGALHAWPPS